MNYKRLGKSGLQVSEVSFGSWVTFGNEVADTTAEDCMKLAYDSGINFFDNAEVYAKGQSEVVMGNILKKMGWARSSYVVSSKAFFGAEDGKPNQHGLSRKHLLEACDAALKRLQVDYLDLYYCHRQDDTVPVEESVRAMSHLVDQGKVLYWGTSEWKPEQIEEAFRVAKEFNLNPPTMEQPQYNLLHRINVEQRLKPLIESYGLGTTTWSPLASGLLTGKYNNGIPKGSRLERETWLQDRVAQEHVEKVKKLGPIADKLGTTTAILSIAWCLKNPDVSTVILGASNIDQLKENLKALEFASKITDEVKKEMEDIVGMTEFKRS